MDSNRVLGRTVFAALDDADVLVCLTHDRRSLMNLPKNLTEELITVPQEGPGIRIERIVSTGHRSPENFLHDQSKSEWGLVLNKAARIEFEDNTVEIGPGDYLYIPAHTKHRVALKTPD